MLSILARLLLEKIQARGLLPIRERRRFDDLKETTGNVASTDELAISGGYDGVIRVCLTVITCF